MLHGKFSSSWDRSGCFRADSCSLGKALGELEMILVFLGWPWVSWGSLGRGVGAVGADPRLVAGGVSPQSLSEWRMQNIARDSENSSEEEFFDAHGTVEQSHSLARTRQQLLGVGVQA